MAKPNIKQRQRKNHEAAIPEAMPENPHCSAQWPFDGPSRKFAELRQAAQGMHSLIAILHADNSLAQICAESDEAGEEVQPFSPIVREGLFLALQVCSAKLQFELDGHERAAR